MIVMGRKFPRHVNRYPLNPPLSPAQRARLDALPPDPENDFRKFMAELVMSEFDGLLFEEREHERYFTPNYQE